MKERRLEQVTPFEAKELMERCIVRDLEIVGERNAGATMPDLIAVRGDELPSKQKVEERLELPYSWVISHHGLA